MIDLQFTLFKIHRKRILQSFLGIACCCVGMACLAQSARDTIYSDFVLQEKRIGFDQHLREQVLKQYFSTPPNRNNEEKYQEACGAIAQFLMQSPTIEKGLASLFKNYSGIGIATRRSFLEAVYAAYPRQYRQQMEALIRQESQPKLFSMQAVYLYRIQPDRNRMNLLLRQLHQNFKTPDSIPILAELKKWLLAQPTISKQKTPDLRLLFDHQKTTGQKIIYSFQRWNRNHPGIAVIQNPDGHFQKDENGEYLMVEQLARAGSDLPYFITDGNTPQGIFSITGTEVSHSLFIGPTPNLQLLMPFEADSAFWHHAIHPQADPLINYMSLLPDAWKNYAPMTESFYAGKIGRTEILAHGTTIDPQYFKHRSFYPLTPTQGCLCAKEIWDVQSGRLLSSEQFKLVNGFLSGGPSTQGYLMVINLDHQQKPVSRDEIKKILERFEHSSN